MVRSPPLLPLRLLSTRRPKMQEIALDEGPDLDFRRRFATLAAGAKERVAQGGAHPSMRDAAAPGPATPASARQGDPSKSPISGDGHPPRAPGRDGAGNSKC